MDIVTEPKPSSVVPGGRAGLVALGLGSLIGLAALGGLLYKAFKPAPAATNRQSAEEARMAAQAQATRSRAEAEVPRMRQEEVGNGYQFDAQGNVLPPRVDPRDLPENQPLFGPEIASGYPSSRIAAEIREGPPPRSWGRDRDEGREVDQGTFQEQRAARQQERADLQSSMLGYTTSLHARWATRQAERMPPASGAEAAPPPAPVLPPGQTGRPTQAWSASTAELTLPMAPEPPSKRPAEMESQVVPPGEVADLRIGGGVGPDVIVREGKFLDCVLVNRLESDIAESPVMAQVARDFLSLDGKTVLVPAGSRIHGTAGRVESQQQAKLFIRFHKIVFPRRTPEETPKVAYFPSRQVPAMDALGRLGVGGKVNRHLMLQFGAAIMLGVFDGLAAQVQSPGSEANPAARDLILARSSQNFAAVVTAVIQRYANVVPTVTVKEGTKLKCYFTQDVMLTPFMATRDLSWVRRAP